jgi:tRNA threonylcarbamoyladenosine modification (KEOPS) complex  Pcc1 subunit
VVHSDSVGLHLVSGVVQNAVIKLQEEHMTSTPKNYKSNMKISFKNKSIATQNFIAKCICSALKPDTKHSSDSGEKIKISSDASNVFIEIETDNIPSLRASINSYLRLVDTSYKCITKLAV